MTNRSITRRSLCVLAACFLLGAGAASADSWAFVGSRYQAMGGTGVAFSDDSNSVYWNPANFAWQKGWDVQIPITLDANVENRAIETLSNLIVTAEDLDSEINRFLKCVPTCSGTPALEPERLMGFLLQLATYGQSGEAVHVNASIGLAGRYNSMGFSVLSLTTATVFPNVDIDNVGLDLASLNLIIGTGQVPMDGSLVTEIMNRPDTGNLSLGQVQQLVWLAEQAGADTGNRRIKKFLGNLAGGTSSGANSFLENNSGALTAGISSQEVGFSYAHKLPVPFFDNSRGTGRTILRYLHNRTSIGGTLKYMLGITFLKGIRYDDTSSIGDILTDWLDVAPTQFTHTAGLDLGLSWRPMDYLSFGMVARNVNSPAFKISPFLSPTTGQLVTEIELNPQVRMGLALVPIKHLTLAFDIDLTENEIVTLPRFKSRILSMGAEYDLPIGRHFGVALRFGTYNNISDAVNQDWAITAGLGLRTGLFQLDASIGSSTVDEIVRTGSNTARDLPTRLNIGIGLKFEKSI